MSSTRYQLSTNKQTSGTSRPVATSSEAATHAPEPLGGSFSPRPPKELSRSFAGLCEVRSEATWEVEAKGPKLAHKLGLAGVSHLNTLRSISTHSLLTKIS